MARRLARNGLGRGAHLALAIAMLIGMLVPSAASQAATLDKLADAVLGQSSFSSGDPNRGLNSAAANTLRYPYAAAVAPDGRLFVADTTNHRVLAYSSASDLANGASALFAIGQPDLTSSTAPAAGPTAGSLYTPEALAFDAAGNLWVADTGNLRILRYSPPFTLGENADKVIGQPLFTSRIVNYGSPDAFNQASDRGFLSPTGIAFDPVGNLWVADQSENRVVRFPLQGGSISSVADLALGQADLASLRADRGLTSAGPGTLDQPYALTFDSAGHLWIADSSNNRVLRYSPPFSMGQDADVVLGQADFTSSARDGGSTSTISAVPYGLDSPLGLAFDSSGRLYVADSYNYRVVVFPPAVGTGGSATGVFGQANLSSAIQASPSDASLSAPRGVAVDSNQNVYVADYGQSRVLRYDTPIAPDATTTNITLSLAPAAATTVVSGSAFDVDIRLSSGNEPVDGVSAYLDFDPTVLQVVDAKGTAEDGTQILDPLYVFDTELQNSVDNIHGQIDLTVGKLRGARPSGDILVGTIRFVAAKASDGSPVTFAGGTSANRKTAVTYAGSSILSSATGGSYVVLSTQVIGHVGLQGRETQAPSSAYSVPLLVEVTSSDGGTQIISTKVTTDQSGQFTLVGLAPGTYGFRVKNQHTLASQRSSVTIATGSNDVDLCTLKEGDADDSNQVDIVDFSILSAAFDTSPGQPKWNSRADFNQSSQINIADFSLLAANFGRYGDQLCPPPAAAGAATASSGQPATSGAEGAAVTSNSSALQLQLNPATSGVKVGQVATLTLQVAAGSQLVDGVGAYLRFDPTYLQIVDSGGQPTTRIEGAKGALETELANAVDNSLGQIRYSAGTLSSAKPSGTFTVATIRVKLLRNLPKAGSTVSFVFDQPSNRETNVVLAGTPVLGGTQGALIKTSKGK